MLAVLAALAAGPDAQPPRDNPADRAHDVIAAINEVRASNGLAALEIDPILMSVAQAQNEWRLATGATTHTGPDGSTPKERAIAAGYGGGATVFISEIIVDGTGLSVSGAIDWWMGSTVHRNTILSPNYVHIGAGAGESGGVWRYTAMTGYVAGGSYTPGSIPPAAAGPVVVPVTMATANPDGSIVHTVASGQTLWTLAAVYGVQLEALMELNGYRTGPLLHPGDQVIIRPAWTPTPTISPTPSRTPTPPPSRVPTRTPTAAPTPTSTPAPVNLSLADPSVRRAVIWFGAVAMLTGLLFGLRHRPS
jgi:LysM repeat protein